MNIALKVIIILFSSFLVAAVIHGLVLVGGWFFPVLCGIIGGATYLMIKKVFFKK